MLRWWEDYLNANMQEVISSFDYAKTNNPLR
ncbi:hypothetical protein SN04_03752 [Serratia marcescens]|nr:hypothetical protein SN04_03752 [Serratia marcescens]